VARIAKEELEETKGLSFASLRNTDTTPTVNLLYDRVRKVIQNMDIGAVYHNLRISREDGKYRSKDLAPR
jgi:hypothetical protein